MRKLKTWGMAHDPAPKKEQTNEEWFDSLTIAEKAMFLANFYRHNGEKLHICVKLEGKFYPEQKRELERWLKEPHN